MTVEVIGAGVGRTGTYSLKLALEQLGLGPCHHMEEVFNNLATQVPLWSAAAAGRPDWQATFSGYRSAVDWPNAAFWRKLMTTYPQARFVLTVRDRERWYESYSQTIAKLMAGSEPPPPLKPWFEMAKAVLAKSGQSIGLSKDDTIRAFDDHNDAVRRALAPERLLVFEVKDGWQPLCAFLGKPVPAQPFPRSNDRADFWDRVNKGMG